MTPGSLGYRTDLEVLAMSGSRLDDRGDHIVVSTPTNPSYWWGNFILVDRVPGPDASQEWLDRFAEAFPTAGHVALGFDGTAGRAEDLAFFAGLGFRAEAQAVMTASRVRPPRRVNRDAVCRELRSERDWEQSVELRMRCQDRPADAGPGYLSAKALANRRMVRAGAAAWFGAFVEDRLVAQLGLVQVEEGLARFQSVETDPAFRRRGLAGTLVERAAAHGFERFGARRLVMVADPGYFAADLDRSLGFATVETQLQVERDSPLAIPAGS